MRALGCLLLICNNLVNIIHDRWLETFTISSSFSDIEFGILQMNDQEGYWMKRMSKSLLFFKMVSVRSLFLKTFCENIFKNFKIIVLPHPQMSKLSWLWFLRAFKTSCCVNHSWINVFRMNNYYYLPSDHPCSWYIWKSEYMIFFLCFKPQRIYLEIGFATLCYFSVVFQFV